MASAPKYAGNVAASDKILLGDEPILAWNGDGGGYAVVEVDPNLIAPLHTRIAVAPHLMGYVAPTREGFNAYFGGLIPNVRISALSKLSAMGVAPSEIANGAEDVVSSLYLWFAGSYTEHPEALRFQAYDPIRFPGIPFYRFILDRVGNMASIWCRRQRRAGEHFLLIDDLLPVEGREDVMERLISGDAAMLAGMQPVVVSIESHCDSQRFIECLEQIASFHANAAPLRSIERRMVKVAEMHSMQCTLREMGRSLHLHSSTVSKIAVELRGAAEIYNNEGAASLLVRFGLPRVIQPCVKVERVA